MSLERFDNNRNEYKVGKNTIGSLGTNICQAGNGDYFLDA